ncbi:MAG: hypothetical protein J6T48_03610 [Bacteroidales bacterium]|nr:hypothetical protein [Bacteroidales bacterium]
MKKKILIIAIVIAAALVTIVLYNVFVDKLNIPKNSIYYWQTDFYLDDDEIGFLDQHDIKRIYLRFFDVDINDDNNFSDKCAPVATLDIDMYNGKDFSDFFEKIDIVPVVFITQEAIREYSSFTDDLAHRLYAMCHDFKLTINEVQFDCDWTGSTRDDFFQFLKDERLALKKYFGKDIMLSSTIRFHQLAQTPPEVEYGVLMCYNTGHFKDFDTKNSILDVEDIKPYMKYLKSYKLPLSLALPTYSWFVEFDENKKFVRLNRYCYDDYQIKNVEGNVYEVDVEYQGQETKYVRYEQVSSETILHAKKMVEDQCGSLPTVLYHLDSKQLSKYSEDEIDSFFN